ncbi:MAG: hypothetical protein KAJ95_10520 [Gammaproteobacteria bacterium]|nr:hypothetical protein [Gammaproteobacteria bacterium]
MYFFSKKSTGFLTLLALFMVISGCGSDSSSETSSGGGSTTTSGGTTGSDTPVSSEPASSFAGTYVGTASVTATAAALNLSQTETVPVTIIISENGTVTIQSGSDLFPDVITLSGNTFGHSQTFNDESFGAATCSGTLTLSGSINNGVLSATLSSQSVVCNLIPGTITGSMTANKQ